MLIGICNVLYVYLNFLLNKISPENKNEAQYSHEYQRKSYDSFILHYMSNDYRKFHLSYDLHYTITLNNWALHKKNNRGNNSRNTEEC